MRPPFLLNFFSIALSTFVAWIAVLCVLIFSAHFPRGVFILLHDGLNIFLFWITFRFFYRSHPNVSRFFTTLQTIFFLCLFELILWIFFGQPQRPFLNYVDFIFPAFLIVTTVYVTGKQGN